MPDFCQGQRLGCPKLLQGWGDLRDSFPFVQDAASSVKPEIESVPSWAGNSEGAKAALSSLVNSASAGGHARWEQLEQNLKMFPAVAEARGGLLSWTLPREARGANPASPSPPGPGALTGLAESQSLGKKQRSWFPKAGS
ncbi:hypothetical protein P7K49_037710 [Saguinus oedipus]|uniref:Uncharacterized protein n=1 Tax=Saguinus oedipus TaxID=9490 RepID=A0ABQ9TIT2_SAGOE|nr:hypothetical protein P7K49_037710 [Saguinus oedipus]